MLSVLLLHMCKIYIKWQIVIFFKVNRHVFLFKNKIKTKNLMAELTTPAPQALQGKSIAMVFKCKN